MVRIIIDLDDKIHGQVRENLLRETLKYSTNFIVTSHKNKFQQLNTKECWYLIKIFWALCSVDFLKKDDIEFVQSFIALIQVKFDKIGYSDNHNQLSQIFWYVKLNFAEDFSDDNFKREFLELDDKICGIVLKNRDEHEKKNILAITKVFPEYWKIQFTLENNLNSMGILYTKEELHGIYLMDFKLDNILGFVEEHNLVSKPEILKCLKNKDFYIEIHGREHYIPNSNQKFDAGTKFKNYLLKKSDCLFLTLTKHDCFELSSLSEGQVNEKLKELIQQTIQKFYAYL